MIPRGGKATVRLQESTHIVHDVTDLAANELENHYERGSSKYTGLIQCYVDGKLHILVRIRRTDGTEFIAHLQRDKSSNSRSEVHEQPLKLHGFAIGLPEPVSSVVLPFLAGREGACGNVVSDGEQQPVLINVVQSMQEPQLFIPTLVRLEPIDFLQSEVVNTTYFSCSSTLGVGVVLSAIENGEAGLSGDIGFRFAHHSQREVIQGASEILQSVPGYERGFDRYRSDVSNEVRNITGLWVALDTNSAWVGFPTGSPEGFEVADVLIGPIELS